MCASECVKSGWDMRMLFYHIFFRISSLECPNNLEVHVVKCWHK